MILAETCPSCSYLITWFVGLLLKITLKGLLVDWKCLWSIFVTWFLNITRKSRNFHVFTQAYLAHAQTNFPAACIMKSWTVNRWSHTIHKNNLWIINNSWRKHKGNHEREGVCIHSDTQSLIFINFNFDFLASYKMYLQNYFANRSIKLESFTTRGASVGTWH